MKKIVLPSIAVAVGLVLVFFGPGFLDLYRLQEYISASADAYHADGGSWPHLTDVCIACHGVKGTSLNQHYPSLAGQPAQYVAAQLQHFASGQRTNPTMGPLAMTLSEGEIKLLSDYYARQSASENRYFNADSRLRAKGEHLVGGGSCVACHGAGLRGRDQFPRLAGQGYDYILKQLNAFAAGTRSEPSGTMKSLAAAMSPEDREAVATYLASLAPNKK
jgi:cytochrome c553